MYNKKKQQEEELNKIIKVIKYYEKKYNYIMIY